MLSSVSDIVVCLNDGPGYVACVQTELNGYHRSRRGIMLRSEKLRVSPYTTNVLNLQRPRV